MPHSSINDVVHIVFYQIGQFEMLLQVMFFELCVFFVGWNVIAKNGWVMESSRDLIYH